MSVYDKLPTTSVFRDLVVMAVDDFSFCGCSHCSPQRVRHEPILKSGADPVNLGD